MLGWGTGRRFLVCFFLEERKQLLAANSISEKIVFSFCIFDFIITPGGEEMHTSAWSADLCVSRFSYLVAGAFITFRFQWWISCLPYKPSIGVFRWHLHFSNLHLTTSESFSGHLTTAIGDIIFILLQMEYFAIFCLFISWKHSNYLFPHSPWRTPNPDYEGRYLKQYENIDN